VYEVDPLAGQVGKRREVLGCREPLRLEAAHLARRSRATLSRPAADNPAHRRIVAQARSKAWIEGFSSTQRTIALAGGST